MMSSTRAAGGPGGGCYTRPHWRTPEPRPMGAPVEITEGARMSNGLACKGHSNDIVGITELIVKRLHCGRFTAAP